MFVEFIDNSTSTKVVVAFTPFFDPAAAALSISCATTNWKGEIDEDGEIAVWVRGNGSEDGNVTMRNKETHSSYKIWEAGYTSPDDA